MNNLPEITKEKKKRVTKRTLNERLYYIEGLILTGLFNNQIRKNIMQLWNISYNQAYQYISKARNALANSNFEHNTQKLKNIHCKHLEYLYKTAIEKEDYAEARKCLADLRTIQGLDGNKEVNINHRTIRDDIPAEKIVEIIQNNTDNE
jgi:hypothetical protein